MKKKKIISVLMLVAILVSVAAASFAYVPPAPNGGYCPRCDYKLWYQGAYQYSTYIKYVWNCDGCYHQWDVIVYG